MQTKDLGLILLIMLFSISLVNNIVINSSTQVFDGNVFGEPGQIPFVNLDGNLLEVSNGLNFNKDTNTLSTGCVELSDGNVYCDAGDFPNPDLSEYEKDRFYWYRNFTNFCNPQTGTVTYGDYLAQALNVGAFLGSDVYTPYVTDPTPYYDTVCTMFARSRSGSSTNSGAGIRSGVGNNPVSDGTLLQYRSAIMFHQNVDREINNNYAAEEVLVRLGWSTFLGSASSSDVDLDCQFKIDDGVIVGYTRHGSVYKTTTSSLTSIGASPDFGFLDWLTFEIIRDIGAKTARFIVKDVNGITLMDETIEDLHDNRIAPYGAKMQAKPICSAALHIATINFVDMKYMNKLNRFGLVD